MKQLRKSIIFTVGRPPWAPALVRVANMVASTALQLERERWDRFVPAGAVEDRAEAYIDLAYFLLQGLYLQCLQGTDRGSGCLSVYNPVSSVFTSSPLVSSGLSVWVVKKVKGGMN